MGSQIRRQGQLIRAILFQGFPYFSVLTNAAMIFMSDKSDKWADENHRGLPVHQQKHRPSVFKIQNNQC